MEKYNKQMQIEVNIKDLDVHLQLKLDKDIIDEYGGIDEVKNYLTGRLYDIRGNLFVPDLKYELNKIDIDATKEKVNIIKSEKEKAKNLSSLVN
jgi:hypothetical protein